MSYVGSLKYPQRVKKTRFILQGGLGNQMFIWAASQFYLGKRQGQGSVELVVSDLARAGTPRNLEIDKFGFSSAVVFSEFTQSHHWLLRATRKFLTIFKIQKNPFLGLYSSKTIGFDEALEQKAHKARFVTGYFQSEKYLMNTYVEEQLKSLDLNSPSDNYKDLLQEIKMHPSIVLHVRRGDYLKFSEEFGVLDAEFFKNSMNKIPGWQDLNLWIFSDERNIQEELETHFPQARYILENQGLNPAETLLLMSAGSHIIISNSSFSWWAAYLMRLHSKNSLVVAPTPWSKNRNDVTSFIPAGWIKAPAVWLGSMP